MVYNKYLIIYCNVRYMKCACMTHKPDGRAKLITPGSLSEYFCSRVAVVTLAILFFGIFICPRVACLCVIGLPKVKLSTGDFYGNVKKKIKITHDSSQRETNCLSRPRTCSTNHIQLKKKRRKNKKTKTMVKQNLYGH